MEKLNKLSVDIITFVSIILTILTRTFMTSYLKSLLLLLVSTFCSDRYIFS